MTDTERKHEFLRNLFKIANIKKRDNFQISPLGFIDIDEELLSKSEMYEGNQIIVIELYHQQKPYQDREVKVNTFQLVLTEFSKRQDNSYTSQRLRASISLDLLLICVLKHREKYKQIYKEDLTDLYLNLLNLTDLFKQPRYEIGCEHIMDTLMILKERNSFFFFSEKDVREEIVTILNKTGI